MYKALNGVIVALSVVGGMLVTQAPANAQGVGISLDVGNVAFGYQDGYWDRGHHWHRWRNRDEANYYRNAQGNQYNDWRHDRDGNQGWQDVSFNVNDVAFGYQDGYWDRSHRWHTWHSQQERHFYRSAPGNQYSDYPHDRDGNQGWRGLSINVGDVAFGYRDGYWDHGHQWHQWHNDQEMRDYRNAHGDRYNDYRHDRDHDQGWHQ